MDTSIAGINARDLFPDLFSDPKKEKTDHGPPPPLPPPPPPDTSWLATGIREADPHHKSDQLRALVVVRTVHTRVIAQQVLEKMGYAVDTPLSEDQALQNLQLTQYQIIICEAAPTLNEVRLYIGRLSSARRRRIFYTIIGFQLQTLYNLEALALSANLVVNNRDLNKLEAILRTGLHDYEDLFGPLLDCLNGSASSL